nr:MAG TPA: hypothetical protein [Caudoviricetes sp.]
MDRVYDHETSWLSKSKPPTSMRGLRQSFPKGRRSKYEVIWRK